MDLIAATRAEGGLALPGFRYSHSSLQIKYWLPAKKVLLRLLLLLAVVDTVHLTSSLLSFSLPTLYTSFTENTYQYTLPYTLPVAQVTITETIKG